MKNKGLCQICGFRRCPPRCPSYSGESGEWERPIGRCDECGVFIYPDDEYYEAGRAIFCAECGEDDDI